MWDRIGRWGGGGLGLSVRIKGTNIWKKDRISGRNYGEGNLGKLEKNFEGEFMMDGIMCT